MREEILMSIVFYIHLSGNIDCLRHTDYGCRYTHETDRCPCVHCTNQIAHKCMKRGIKADALFFSLNLKKLCSTSFSFFCAEVASFANLQILHFFVDIIFGTWCQSALLFDPDAVGTQTDCFALYWRKFIAHVRISCVCNYSINVYASFMLNVQQALEGLNMYSYFCVGSKNSCKCDCVTRPVQNL